MNTSEPRPYTSINQHANYYMGIDPKLPRKVAYKAAKAVFKSLRKCKLWSPE